MPHYSVEVRRWQYRVGPPFFVTLGNERGYQGFRSVYAYPDHVRKHITQTRTTAGIEDMPVFSDMLFLDFDNVDPTDAIMHLYDEGYGFTVWTSGNRSYHVHVSIEPMLDADAPYSQRVWAEKFAPGCDLSFYHHAGQFRLAGTPHEKTGQRKELLRSKVGDLLTIPLVGRPRLTAPGTMGGRAGNGAFASRLLRGKGEGGRRVYVWHLAKVALAEGLPLDVALREILWWNSRYATPSLNPNQVSEKVHEVYRGSP